MIWYLWLLVQRYLFLLIFCHTGMHYGNRTQNFKKRKNLSTNLKRKQQQIVCFIFFFWFVCLFYTFCFLTQDLIYLWTSGKNCYLKVVNFLKVDCPGMDFQSILKQPLPPPPGISIDIFNRGNYFSSAFYLEIYSFCNWLYYKK